MKRLDLIGFSSFMWQCIYGRDYIVWLGFVGKGSKALDFLVQCFFHYVALLSRGMI